VHWCTRPAHVCFSGWPPVAAAASTSYDAQAANRSEAAAAGCQDAAMAAPPPWCLMRREKSHRAELHISADNRLMDADKLAAHHSWHIAGR